MSLNRGLTNSAATCETQGWKPNPRCVTTADFISGLAKTTNLNFPEALPPIFALGKPASVLGQQGRAFSLHGGRQ